MDLKQDIRTRLCSPRRLGAWTLYFAGLVTFAIVVPRLAGAGKTVAAEDVLTYVEATADWYRHVLQMDWTPINSEEVQYRSTVRQRAQEVLKLGLEFGRAQAYNLVAAEQSGRTTTAPLSGRAASLAKAAATAEERARQLREQADFVGRELETAAPTSRPIIDARLERLRAQIRLLTARRDVLRNLIDASSETTTTTPLSLLKQLDDLQDSVPQFESTRATTQAVTPHGATPQTVQGEAPGILGLVTQMISLSRQMREISDNDATAEKLLKDNDRLRTPVRTEIMDMVHRSDEIIQGPEPEDPAVLAQQRMELDMLTYRIGELSLASVPLQGQEMKLRSSRTGMSQWTATLSRAYTDALQSLLLRLAITMSAVLIVLVISNIWRRATFRYIHDVRRRVQFLLVRRIVVSFILIIILISSFLTEFGSLATFAGILTAGVAVALQTFIVSGVAYFFFIGRYGVRVGDRVTVGGITGDVIDVGIFRFYLMELGGTDSDRHPTGRIVFFSNSVLFQPAAFFKQIPGVDYTWQKVTIRLAPETDHQTAERKLMAAVESVYTHYRAEIDRQHEDLRKTLHLPFDPPKPEGRLRILADGIEFTVRYPVDMRQAVEVEDRITQALLLSIEKEPTLKLAAMSPKIETVK